MNSKKILLITLLLTLTTFACNAATPSPLSAPTIDEGPQQTQYALETSQSNLESQQETLSAQQTSDEQARMNEQATISAPETATTIVEVTEQIEEPTETQQEVEISEIQFTSPDTFDDNRNQWILNEYTEIADGLFKYRKPPERGSWTWCKTCQVTSENNEVSVEGKNISPGLSIYGLILDNGTCSSDPIAFIINSQGAFAVLQGVFDESGDFSYWRPFIDVTGSAKIIKGQNAVNKLSATYEFADEVWMTIFVNGTQLTRFKAFESSGADTCVAGLYVLSDIDFDNFAIQ
jgi:hypothetical protein